MSLLTTIPLFITGKTKEELIVNMLKNNASKSMKFMYFDIQKDGKIWVAWYYCDIENDAKLELKQVSAQ